jgi:hypothetical protein
VINLTKGDGKDFIPIVCFLLTLTGKILNLNSASLLDTEKRHELSNKVCDLLFNFIENCPNGFLYHPLRALMEHFQKDSTENALSKCLNSTGLY